MKTIKLSVLVLTLLSAIGLPAFARAESLLEKIAVTILADKFGIKPQQAVVFQTQTKQTVFEAAPVYSISYYTHRPVNEVWKLRQQGLGWGQIAHHLGMNPGRFNKLRKAGAFDRDTIWASIFKDRYGVRDSDIILIRKRGGSMRDVLATCIIARESHNSPIVVYTRYQRDRDWDRTAVVYKVDLRNHDKHARLSSAADRARATQISKGNDNGKDRVDGKGPGKGEGKGEGKDKGKGKGHGNDKGNGHGKGGG